MQLTTTLRALCCVALFAVPATRAAADTAVPDIQRFVLDNGLTLIVKPDHRAPVAVQMVWVRAGGFNEVSGETGISHMLEHMMFKGTDTLGPNEFSRRVAALGGNDNAFTTMDYTGYFQQIPAAKLAEVMALQANVFAHNRFDDAEYVQENRVVQEERRMRTDDSPRSRLREQQMAETFMVSPYHHPVVGWMSDIEQLTPDNVRDYYRAWYVPGNAAVVVVGDVDPQAVLELAQKTYGAIPARALPELKKRPEPAQDGVRRLELQAPAAQAVVSMNWRVPQLTGLDATTVNDEALALTVLEGVLDGYEGARLERALTQGTDPVATAVDANNGLVGRGPQLFTLSAVVTPGKTPAEAEAALRAQVVKVAQEGVGAAELERVKTQWIASQTYKRDSVMGQAQEIGFWWVEGFPLDTDDRLVERLAKVTAAQVQAVAAKYFNDAQLTVATLIPQARADGAAPVPVDAADSGSIH